MLFVPRGVVLCMSLLIHVLKGNRGKCYTASHSGIIADLKDPKPRLWLHCGRHCTCIQINTQTFGTEGES